MRWNAKMCLCAVISSIFLMTLGCSDGVKEDRSINFSREGDRVGFQHGKEGVFVANSQGGELKKIYEVDEDSIAISSPLWAPTDKRLIFTVARPANRGSNSIPRVMTAWDANPDGRSFQAEVVDYACLLRADATAGDPAVPTSLFEASCNHPGYVAANLAVRWHPDGKRILFVDRTKNGGHSLYEYDLATKKRRRLLQLAADALIFDWTPDGAYLVCVLASHLQASQVNGIWIRSANQDEWWRVPKSEKLAIGQSRALLERLRSTRPAWTRDNQHFAFVIRHDLASDEERENIPHSILVADMTTRRVKSMYKGTQGRIRDLRWHPTTDRLGFVEGERSQLRIIHGTSEVSIPSKDPVRRFAGWNHDGSRLAYVSAQPSSKSNSEWALLFFPIKDARDRVFVTDGDNPQQGNLVHSEMRITFPQWSPTDDQLSLWATYTPTHRSWLSIFLPWTLHPGDPAAILDCPTGEMKWMAVNAGEQSQVGHYYLLKRDYQQAWNWYEKSAKKRKPAQPIKLGEMEQFVRQLRVHQDPTFFEYHCLTKLGRHEEAKERLAQFRQAMTIDPDGGIEMLARWNIRGDGLEIELKRVTDFVTPFLRYAYATEVYLSLNAVADGVEFFQEELQAKLTDVERFAAALCLSQLLLVNENYPAYAELVTKTIGPLLKKMGGLKDLEESGESNTARSLRESVETTTLSVSAGLVVLPMISQKFLSTFSEEQLRSYLSRWQELRDQVDSGHQALIEPLILALEIKLGDNDAREALDKRIKLNQAIELDDISKVDELIESIRTYAERFSD